MVPGSGSAQQKNYFYHDLFSVSFPTENDGWVCGRWGSILHTGDGGKSWVRQKSGTDFTLASICFADPKQGWAVGDGGTIIHTADGGKTWQKQKGPAVPVEGGKHRGFAGIASDEEARAADLFYMGVHFANAWKGWIVGERTHILSTEDGGKTWQIQFSDVDFILKSVSFCDECSGWAVGEYGYIYHTDDGGVTWAHQAGRFDFSAEINEIIGGNSLFDVVAIDRQTAWVVGIDGYVAGTVDGGATWQQATEGIPKTHLFGIAADGPENLLIGGKAVLLTSLDGGRTFKRCKADPPITSGWIYQVASRGADGFVAVGKMGWIYLTDWDVTVWRRVKY